ncbi:hypothetical protein BCV72DRAFT_36979 [Rhizopus microsporus var. microsporus]|uniref:Ribosome biogenesis protein NSA1 n=1 Tax=Rhizopus microsporus var. microsporus TaxID=86635 RepID=A0A1X0QTL4_RHIZD|nr:hypothetical protein BCV72DRAFT_36979 [Rhizopus microsporus var. microsporus]
MSPEDGLIVKELKNKHVGTEEKQGYFVGLFVHNNHLCVCTSTGDLSYTPLDAKETCTITNLGSNLEIMRNHPVQTHIFAIGGKDQDLRVYNIEELLKDKEFEVTDAAGPQKNTSTHKKKSTKNTGLIFQAKNVKNDFLDLQQPVWIHDLQFMNKEATKIVVSTHYHQFRLYDTKAGRRPVINAEIGKHPIKVLSVGKDFNHVLFADTMGTVGTIDIRTGKRAAQYKGFTGACTALATAPQPEFEEENNNSKEQFVISTSLDRFLRIHETSTVYRNIVEKNYLKQRLTCLLVDQDFVYPLPKSSEEEEDDEDLWESMEVVDDRKRKRHG